MTVAAIVLAAGGSTRMRSPKQLLLLDGQSLLVRAVEAVGGLPVVGVMVVLGANEALIKPLVIERTRVGSAGKPVRTVTNADWALGMGGSIRVGVTAVLAEWPEVDAILITLCDQPKVSTESLQNLLSSFGVGDCAAVAAEYADTVGVPAVFGRTTFDALLSLKSGAGAKAILSDPTVESVAMPEAASDVDTPDDFAAMTRPG